MRDFLCVAWVTFLGEMSRGVVVPVLWPYLQSVLLHQFIRLVDSSSSQSFYNSSMEPYNFWDLCRRASVLPDFLPLPFLDGGQTGGDIGRSC